MSVLYVDNLQPNLGSAVHAAGHVVQFAYAKLSDAVSASAASYDVVTLNFTPKFATSTLLLETSVFLGETAAYNMDLGVKILRDGTAVETGADADAGRGGDDVLDSMDDVWSADNRGQWFRLRLGGAITTNANSTSQSTYIVRVQTSATTTFSINRTRTGTVTRGISYLKITEIAQ